MSMTVEQAQAANDLIRWITGTPRGSGAEVTADEARDAAQILATGAHKRMAAGFTAQQVGEVWRRQVTAAHGRDAELRAALRERAARWVLQAAEHDERHSRASDAREAQYLNGKAEVYDALAANIRELLDPQSPKPEEMTE